MKKIIVFSIFMLAISHLSAQQTFVTVVDFLKDEYWWCCNSQHTRYKPYLKPIATHKPRTYTATLLLSNKGRYIWNEKPFVCEIADNLIKITSYNEINVVQAGKTLKEAYLTACKEHFPPNGFFPDESIISKPQYITDGTQENVLRYAKYAADNNFPEGIIIINENWQKCYGSFDFAPDKFPDPKDMISTLQRMGYKTVLTVTPFVSPDSDECKELNRLGYLIKRKGSNIPAIIEWRNGQSACFDFTNPDAVIYFTNQLNSLQNNLLIDGFLLDQSDCNYYNPEIMQSFYNRAKPEDHILVWANVGTQFPFCIYRTEGEICNATYSSNFQTKEISWDALQTVIPEIIEDGFSGNPFTCLEIFGNSSTINNVNQELLVRATQLQALMPMMLLSIASWANLSDRNLDIVNTSVHLRQRMIPYLLQYAHESAKTGEPIVRHMEYAFPNEGFALCNDQFMFGEKYLVAPVVKQGITRNVMLPKGKWRDDKGKEYKGGKTLNFNVPLDRLLYFEKLPK